MAVTERFEIPPEMRAFAEKSVEQARQAFDGFISAAHRAVTTFEGQAESARKGGQGRHQVQTLTGRLAELLPGALEMSARRAKTCLLCNAIFSIAPHHSRC